MTSTNESIAAQLINAFADLAAINADIFDPIIALADHLPAPIFAALANAFELCPMHRCDAAICADDMITECLPLRS